MILYLSPAKTMRVYEKEMSKPLFDNQEIVHHLKKMSKSELQKMLKVSDKIVNPVYDSLQKPHPLGPSGYVYLGEAFKSLDLPTISKVDEEAVLIGSAYYGLTKISTAIDFHRLDFNTSIPSLKQSLYHFWKPTVISYLLKRKQPIINCASNEYFKLINDDRLDIINVSFIDNGKVVSALAKKARGLYARSFLENPKNYNKIQILDYKLDNSNPKELVYTR